MIYPDLKGKLLALDLYNCDANILENSQKLIESVKIACAETQMELLKIEHSDAEEGKAYSLFGICIQGHVLLHVFPEFGFCTIDIYSCTNNSSPAKCGREIRKALNPDKVKITVLDRGDFGSESDMKPHRRSSSKFIRRTRSIGRGLKRMILKPRGI